MTTGRGRVALLAMALAAVAVGCGGETIEPDELSGRMAFTGFRDGATPLGVERADSPAWTR